MNREWTPMNADERGWTRIDRKGLGLLAWKKADVGGSGKMEQVFQAHGIIKKYGRKK